MRIIATPCLAEELDPGDLFSTRGPAYWEKFHDFYSCGEALYVRTEMPARNFPDPDTVVFRITIQKKENQSMTSEIESLRAQLASARKALVDVRQELWVEYCLRVGTSSPGEANTSSFNSTPHIRIIDAALHLEATNK